MTKTSIHFDFAVFFSLIIACLVLPKVATAADMPNAKGMLLTPQSFSPGSSPVLRPETKPVGVQTPVESVTQEDSDVSCLMAKNHCQSICVNRFAGIRDDAEFYKNSEHQLKLFEKRRCLSSCNKELSSCVGKKN